MARGWTQLELAVRAGVSDRTVRKAEKSQPIRRQFLEFIACALQSPLAEVSQASRELIDHLNWQRNFRRFVVGMHETLVERNPANMMDLSHPDIEMRVHSQLPQVETLSTFVGDYFGRDELHRFADRTAQFWSLGVSGVVALDEPFGSGNTIVLRGTHEFFDRFGNVTWGRYFYITEFEGERVRRVEGLIRPCSPPPGVTGILVPQNQR